MIRFDRTSRSVVAVCTVCGARDVFTAQGPADAWALDHLGRIHPDRTPARDRSLSAARSRRHRDR